MIEMATRYDQEYVQGRDFTDQRAPCSDSYVRNRSRPHRTTRRRMGWREWRREASRMVTLRSRLRVRWEGPVSALAPEYLGVGGPSSCSRGRSAQGCGVSPPGPQSGPNPVPLQLGIRAG